MNHRQEPEAGVLYVVGTPIGNLGDLSPRASLLLSNVANIACEDTRHSGRLLKSISSKAKLISFHKHNSKSKITQLIEILESGDTLALISDAGLPGISDPGEDLVSAVKSIGKSIICVPGPCAALTALVTSGLPSNRFSFEGFLPAKGKKRKELIKKISKDNKTTIIYESPHKLKVLLEELQTECGKDRPLQVSRELTKIYEQHIGNNIGEVLEYFSCNKVIGEFTLVLGGTKNESIKENYSDSELIKKLRELKESGISSSDATKILSKELKISRKILYSLLH